MSEYLENSRFNDVTNKKVISKMEDETKSVLIAEFGNNKTYEFIKDDGEYKKSKINHEEYKNTIFEKEADETQNEIVCKANPY